MSTLHSKSNRSRSIFLIALILVSLIAMIPQQDASALTVATRTDGPDYTSYGTYSLSDRGGGVWYNSTTILIAEADTNDIKLTSYNKTANAITKQETVAVINLDNPTNPSGTSVGSSTKNNIIMLQSLGGTTQLLNNAGTTFFAESLNAAGSELVGQTVNEVHLWLKKTGAPTGTATIAVFDSTCTSVYTFGTQDSATLTTSFVEMTYRGSGAGRTLANGDRIGVFFTGGSAGNSVDVEYSAADRFDGTTNTITHTATGAAGSCTPTAQTAREVHMQLGFNHVAVLVDDGNDDSYWENVGFSVQAIATDSAGVSSMARQREVDAGNSPAIVELLEKKTTASDLAGRNVDRIELRLSKTGSPTGTATIAEFNADSSATNHMSVNAGTATNCIFSSSTAEACAEHVNAGSALIGDTVNSMTAMMFINSGSPTGTARFCVMNSSAACLYEFGNIAMSTLQAGGRSYTFTNYDASWTISEGEFLGIKGDLQGGAQQVATQGSTTDQFDTTLSARSDYVSGSWGADLVGDMGSTGAEQMFRLDRIVPGTIRNTFGTIDVSTLTTTETVYTFTSSSDFTLDSGATTYVGIRYTGGTLGNTVNAATIAADTYNGTSASIFTTLSNLGYVDNTGSELRFRLVDTEANDVEAGAYVYIDAGSSVAAGAILLKFPDTTKIPQKLDLESSPDASTWTVRREGFTPDQSTANQVIEFYTAPVTARYYRIMVDTWGPDLSFAVANFNYIASTQAGDMLAAFNPDGTIFAFGCLTTCSPSPTTMVVTRINVPTWSNDGNSWTEASHSVSLVSDGTGGDGPGAFGGATEDFVYMIEMDCDCTSLDFWLHRFDYNLTASSIIDSGQLHTSAGSGYQIGAPHKIWAFNTGGVDTVVADVRTNDGSPGIHKIYKWVGTGTEQQIGVNITPTDLVWSTAYGTADGKVYFLMSEDVAITDRTTYIADTVTETYTTDAREYNGLPNGDGFSSKAGGVLTFSSDPEKLYLGTQTLAHGIDALNSRGEQVPFYVGAKDVGAGQLKQADIRYYYLGDGYFIESSAVSATGTSWTFAKYTGTQATMNLFIESLAVALNSDDSDDRTWDNQLIFLACDGLFTVPTSKLIANSFSDCTQYTTKDIPSNAIGRELPFTITRDLVWAAEYTNYNIHLTVTSGGDATDFAAHVKYQGTLVDRNPFDAANNAQVRLLYGQCYDLDFVNILSGLVEDSTTLCADDVLFKEAILSTGLGFTFWTAPWGVIHTWNDTSNILSLTVRHTPFPYNYTVQIYNATNQVIVTDNQNSTTEIENNNYNLTAFPNDGQANAQNPFKVVVKDENGLTRYEVWFDLGGDYFRTLREYFGDINFNGWGILLFLPLIFAALFTRNNAGIGGALVVVFIGFLVFFGFLSGAIFTPIILGLLMFIAIIGLLAYRQFTQ